MVKLFTNQIPCNEAKKGHFKGVVKEFFKEKQSDCFQYTIISTKGEKVVFLTTKDISMKEGDEFEGGL